MDDVAAVQHAVLRCADVDERGLHAGQHVLHAAEVDVAVDRSRVVGRQRDVVLDERAAFEHADVGHAVVALVHDHEVAARGPALPPRAPAAFQRLLVERIQDRGAVDVDVADRGAGVHVRRGLRPLPRVGRRRAAGTGAAVAVAVAVALAALAAASTAPPAPALLRCAFAVAVAASPPAAGDRLSPTLGFAAAAGAGRESPIRGRPPFRVGQAGVFTRRRRRGPRTSARGRRPRRSSLRPGRRPAAGHRRRPRRDGCRARCPRHLVVFVGASASAIGVRRSVRARARRALPAPATARPRRRRFLGVPSAVVSTVPPAECRARRSRRGVGDFRSDGGSRRSAALLGSSVSCRSSSPCRRSARTRPLLPSLMTRAPPAHAGACRHRAVPTACRRARSIGAYAACALRRVVGRTTHAAIAARISPGFALRGCVDNSMLTSVISSVSRVVLRHIDVTDDRADVFDDLAALAPPLGRQFGRGERDLDPCAQSACGDG